MKQQIILYIFGLLSITTFGQVEKNSELYKVIKEKDSLLFNLGFNNCDIIQFENLLSENFEFYHDQGGITSSKAVFISEIKNRLCKLAYKPKRVLSEHSMEVYPLKKNGVLYGAIQTGTHNFYAIEDNKSEYLTSIAKFTHVWVLENGDFKLTRGLSYDHRDFENTTVSFGQGSNESDKTLVEKLIIESFNGIWSELNSGNIDKYYTKDFLLLENGEVWNNDSIANYLDNAILRKPIPERINTIEIIEIKVADRTAWIAYHNYATFSTDDEIIRKAHWLESATAILTEDGWKLDMLHSTRIE